MFIITGKNGHITTGSAKDQYKDNQFANNSTNLSNDM